MKLISIQTVKVDGKYLAPDTEFDIGNDAGKTLIELGAAKQKTRLVADDDGDIPVSGQSASAKEGVAVKRG